MSEFYKYHDNAYHLHRETESGEELVHSMPAMKDGIALAPGEEPSQLDANEQPVPTKHQRIALAYFADDKTLVTHGDAGALRAWVEAHNSVSARKAALYVFKDSAPAEDINRALEDPAYLATIVK